ncbi:hypothetical protein FA13DRAFT_1910292 [Coprinellus micaceus]|uniref:Uncharacterized protein n=1 Tax=Coprinellus micaceus TaxID=71717 RepID=A0A4Y7TMB0_COPMI|nr:hypothetical protein FA13DRAFT_1910292 [Coprinellus micaceus]
MHLTVLNITDVLMKLFRGTLDLGPGDNKSRWGWAVLMEDKVWKQHGQLVEDFKEFLSSSIDRPPRNPAKKINSGYKAKEFLTYVYGMLPALLYNVLLEPYYSNFCDLVWGVRILTQRSISREELQSAHKALINFVIGFETIYVQREGSRIHFICQCIHNLIHPSPETVRTGPQSLLSQWVMERTIGNLAQVNTIIALLDLDPTPPPPRGSTQYGKGLYLLHPTGPVTKMKKAEAEAFLEYALQQDPTFNIPDDGVTFAKKGCLRLPNQQIGRTAWKEKAKLADAALRVSQMVKIVEEYSDEEGNITKDSKIAEVEYFFEGWINGKKEGLAMVSLCDDPDHEILSHSKNVLWVTQYTSGENLYVVSIASIKSIVSLLPFEKIPGTMFLFKDLGLDVSYLNSVSFVQGEDGEEFEDE